MCAGHPASHAEAQDCFNHVNDIMLLMMLASRLECLDAGRYSKIAQARGCFSHVINLGIVLLMLPHTDTLDACALGTVATSCRLESPNHDSNFGRLLPS